MFTFLIIIAVICFISGVLTVVVAAGINESKAVILGCFLFFAIGACLTIFYTTLQGDLTMKKISRAQSTEVLE